MLMLVAVSIFSHDPLEATVLVATLVGIIAVGWAVWRAKTAEVAKAGIETWKAIAEGYQEKLEQRDSQITELRAQHAAETATLTAQIDELRRQVDQLRERDQTAVLAALRAHEATVAEIHAAMLSWQVGHDEAAERRASSSLTVLEQIRDAITQEGATT